jgi:hypothetical protein
MDVPLMRPIAMKHRPVDIMLAAMLFANEPSFDESDWLLRIATIGVRTQANFEKPSQSPALVFGKQGHDWKLHLAETQLA